MDLRRLQYFVALAEDQNFRRAAARVHVTQSALWRQVKTLEDELGTPLFERQGRHIRLLDTGRVLLDDARRLLDDAQKIRERVIRTGRGQTGVVRIGMMNAASVFPHPSLMSAVRRFRAVFPNVELDITSDHSVRLLAALTSGALDGAFVFRNATRTPGISYLDIESSRDVVALISKEHPLSNRRSLKLADLKDEDFLWIHREISPELHDQLLKACLTRGGFTPKVAQRIEGGHVAFSMVAISLAISILPAAWLYQYSRVIDNVSAKRLTDFTFPSSLSYAWRSDAQPGASSHFVDAFRAFLKEWTEAQRSGAAQLREAGAAA